MDSLSLRVMQGYLLNNMTSGQMKWALKQHMVGFSTGNPSGDYQCGPSIHVPAFDIDRRIFHLSPFQARKYERIKYGH